MGSSRCRYLVLWNELVPHAGVDFYGYSNIGVPANGPHRSAVPLRFNIRFGN